jgi:hypothetical protein
MPWTCPACKKKFKNPNQEHSCARVPVDAHLKNKPAAIRMIYDRIIMEVQRFGPYTLNPVKSSIQVKAGATFLSVKPKRDRVDIEFFLSREEGREPVTKCFRVSGNRVLTCATIDNVMQVNERLVGWIRESYELIRAAN